MGPGPGETCEVDPAKDTLRDGRGRCIPQTGDLFLGELPRTPSDRTTGSLHYAHMAGHYRDTGDLSGFGVSGGELVFRLTARGIAEAKGEG
jgi:hypothetical protein